VCGLTAACSGSSGGGSGETSSGEDAGEDAAVVGVAHKNDAGVVIHSDDAGVSAAPEASTPSGDGGSVSTGDAGACVPTAGTAVLQAFCGSLGLAVMSHDGAATSLLLTGSVQIESGAQEACVAVDGVDIMSGSTVVQHLNGLGANATPAQVASGVIASAESPPADITNRCTSDDASQRIDTYGVIVKGRTNGGTFTASCAEAALGESWPPALTVTCHKNMDVPTFGADITVQSSTFMGMTFTQTMADLIAPYETGGAITSIDDGMYVIPARAPWDTSMPIASFDTTGWMGSVSSGLNASYEASEIEMMASTNPFPLTLCPAGSTGLPEAGAPPPPIFIGRITGSGGRGAFSTEVVFGGCVVENTTPP
jgi:hypothetical protein